MMQALSAQGTAEYFVLILSKKSDKISEAEDLNKDLNNFIKCCQKIKYILKRTERKLSASDAETEL